MTRISRFATTVAVLLAPWQWPVWTWALVSPTAEAPSYQGGNCPQGD